MSIKVRVPGKVLLTGEHSVLYGSHAIAMAIDRYVDIDISDNKVDNFFIKTIEYEINVNIASLITLKLEIDSKYKMYLEQKISIDEVLPEPKDFILYSIINILEYFQIDTKKVENIFSLTITTNLIFGCGIGGSAALVVALLYAMKEYYQVAISDIDFIEFARSLENIQHGRSSGLDIAIAYYGGFRVFQADRLHMPIYKLEDNIFSNNLYIINTGNSYISTGSVVKHVANQKIANNIWMNFKAVADDMEQAIRMNCLQDFKHAIYKNNCLLNLIGVVPDVVMRLIEELWQSDIAAKLTGAGSHLNHGAGMILAVSDSAHLLKKVVSNYGYDIIKIQGDSNGARLLH